MIRNEKFKCHHCYRYAGFEDALFQNFMAESVTGKVISAIVFTCLISP
jgi:hypothetical protein